jgi:hypothetical protein
VQLHTTHPPAFESIKIDATVQCEMVSEQPVPTSSRRASSIESDGGYSAAYPPIPITLATCDVEECSVHCHLIPTAARTHARFDAIISIGNRDACTRRFGDCVKHARIVLTHMTRPLDADLCMPIDRRVSVRLIQSIAAASNCVVSVVMNMERPSAHSQQSVVQRCNAKQKCARTTGASTNTGCSIDLNLGKPVPRLDTHIIQFIRSKHSNTTCNCSFVAITNRSRATFKLVDSHVGCRRRLCTHIIVPVKLPTLRVSLRFNFAFEQVIENLHAAAAAAAAAAAPVNGYSKRPYLRRETIVTTVWK